MLNLQVAASTSTAATGAGVAYRPPGMLSPQRIELPGYLNTPARRPDGEPLSPEVWVCLFVCLFVWLVGWLVGWLVVCLFFFLCPQNC